MKDGQSKVKGLQVKTDLKIVTGSWGYRTSDKSLRINQYFKLSSEVDSLTPPIYRLLCSVPTSVSGFFFTAASQRVQV